MPTQRTIPFDRGVFSITFTCAKWLPLIQQVDGYDLVYNWFDVLKSKGHSILGYVIMPNHVHVMIAFRQTDIPINTLVGNGKRFMAYTIVDRLKEMGANDTLFKLSASVELLRKTSNKQHNVWELSFDWKHCTTTEFMKQKLNYYHINPCKGKWMLAATPVDYVHSSAYYYHTGQQAVYAITNYLDIAEMHI